MKFTADEHDSIRAAIDFITTQIDGIRNPELLKYHRSVLRNLRNAAKKISKHLDKDTERSIKKLAAQIIKKRNL